MRLFKGDKEIIFRTSDFEETCMYMSYRYAIGRHSIAACMHANDIATHFFYRLSNNRKEFNSFDIAREIDSQLRYLYNLYIEYPNENKNYYPFEILMSFIKKNDIRCLNEFNKYKRINYNCTTKEFDVEFDKSYIDKYHSNEDGSLQKEEYDIKKDYTEMDLEDLLHWQKLSACLDIKNLKVIKTLYEGKEEEYICFKTYFLQYGVKDDIDPFGRPYQVNDLENIWWDEHWMPVDKYVKGNEYSYIADEYITSIRDITEKECEQFEGYEKRNKNS